MNTAAAGFTRLPIAIYLFLGGCLMKIVVSKKAAAFTALGAVIGLSAFVLLNAAGWLFNVKSISVFAAMAELNRFEVQNSLLKDAMGSVGVCSPRGAADVWAKGLKNRNAAMQYAVMSKGLKKDYEEQLAETAPNWVTGMSSPWIQSYRILELKETGGGEYAAALTFSTLTSTGPAEKYAARLHIVPENGFYRISEISMDGGLYAYTGFLE